MAAQQYDAIVVGSGISGGWAAKELTEKGLKVLLLERGRNIEHIKDYVNADKEASFFICVYIVFNMFNVSATL